MKTSSKIIIAVLSIVIVIALVVIIYIVATGGGRNGLSQADSVTLETGDLEKIVFADGKVRSENYVQIYPDSSGIVKEIIVSENNEVAKDDLLLKIEITDQTGKTSTQEIKSPIAGTVTNIWAELENQVSPGQTPLIEIVDLNALRIGGLVLESDINKVAGEQKVKLDFPALDDEDSNEYTGKVIYVAQSPNDLDSTNPSYAVTVEPDELPDTVKFGMTVNMEIVVDELKNVVHVDNVFLFSKDGNSYVNVLTDTQTGRTEEVEVELGFEGENATEITSGVDEGDKIVLPTLETEESQAGFFGGNN